MLWGLAWFICSGDWRHTIPHPHVLDIGLCSGDGWHLAAYAMSYALFLKEVCVDCRAPFSTVGVSGVEVKVLGCFLSVFSIVTDNIYYWY
jgi:hypothetical protein